MRRLTAILTAFLLFSSLAGAQESFASLPDSLLFQNSFLDTVKVNKHSQTNDYLMIGVNYGMTFSNMSFNPARHNRAYVTTPNYVSVTFTKYNKLFDILPYCGLVFGVAYGHEGFSFQENNETGYTQDIDGATWCSMDVIEAPFLTQIHIDAAPLKFMGNAGVYGGYRRSIERKGPMLEQEFTNSFRKYEHQIDYGFQGGVGFGLMFDPIEIHFNCLVRWSWSSLYDPDYYSSYYYRYAYPLDIMATVGVHFQLTKRTGRTTNQLRAEAKNKVYGENGNPAGKGR